jgi:hypothetical protein
VIGLGPVYGDLGVCVVGLCSRSGGPGTWAEKKSRVLTRHIYIHIYAINEGTYMP